MAYLRLSPASMGQCCYLHQPSACRPKEALGLHSKEICLFKNPIIRLQIPEESPRTLSTSLRGSHCAASPKRIEPTILGLEGMITQGSMGRAPASSGIENHKLAGQHHKQLTLPQHPLLHKQPLIGIKTDHQHCRQHRGTHNAKMHVLGRERDGQRITLSKGFR